MKVRAELEHLLKVFYTIYAEDSVVRQYGIYPWNLTDRSGISFEDAGDALAAVNRMREQGWIRVLSARHAGPVGPSDRIQLTKEGIGYAEWLRRPWFLKHIRSIYAATVEGITRAITRR